MTIDVRYSCDACGLRSVVVSVPARMSDDEDVAVWMDRTVRLTWQDHWRRSPHCRPETLTNLMIPVSGATRVGGVSVQ